MDHQFDHIEDKVHTVVELMGETEVSVQAC